MISWITISSLSWVFRSTKGRLPAFRATRRFWIGVDSLNRPRTLFTIASSRSSSIISVSLHGGENMAQLVDRPFDVVVDDLEAITVGGLHFAAGDFQPPLDFGLAFGAAVAEPAFQLGHRDRPYENRQSVGVMF